MMTEFYKKILENNQKWVEEKLSLNPNFFSKLAQGQQPPLLWIGCSDSRVPANEIIGAEAGEVFVHRNIANMVVHTDLNMLSVLQYAVEYLKVEHIIVCGHYGCGGVDAAVSNKSFGLINKWLRNIKEVYKIHQQEVDEKESHVDRVNKLVELNVIEQCQDLIKTSIIQKAWKTRNAPEVHGWVYGLSNGIINELITIKPDIEAIHPLFRYDDSEL
jgi:carbonic anhydrase